MADKPVPPVADLWPLPKNNEHHPVPPPAQDTTRAAIERVILEDRRISDEEGIHDDNATVQDYLDGIKRYCDRMERLPDMLDCPQDFKVAMKHHLQAWREWRKTILNPLFIDWIPEGTKVSKVSFSLSGNIEFNLSVRLASDRIKSTFEDVERIAAKYDVFVK